MSAYDIFADFKPLCEQEERDKAQILRFLDVFPDALSRENTVAHVTASAWVVNAERTHVLMAYHNIYDSWAWTGGHADGDADLAAVALREAREETGAEACLASAGAVSIETLCVNQHMKRGKYVSAHLHMNATYLLIADMSRPIRPKDDENRAVSWFTFEGALAASREEVMKPIYEKLISRSRI